MSFADHFSASAAGYAAFGPHYPDALFDWLAQQAPARRCAWDCATGSGQAAPADDEALAVATLNQALVGFYSGTLGPWWTPAQPRQIRWPLALRVCRKPSA